MIEKFDLIITPIHNATQKSPIGSTNWQAEWNENSSFFALKKYFFRLEKLLWASYPVERKTWYENENFSQWMSKAEMREMNMKEKATEKLRHAQLTKALDCILHRWKLGELINYFVVSNAKNYNCFLLKNWKKCFDTVANIQMYSSVGTFD